MIVRCVELVRVERRGALAAAAKRLFNVGDSYAAKGSSRLDAAVLRRLDHGTPTAGFRRRAIQPNKALPQRGAESH